MSAPIKPLFQTIDAIELLPNVIEILKGRFDRLSCTFIEIKPYVVDNRKGIVEREICKNNVKRETNIEENAT